MHELLRYRDASRVLRFFPVCCIIDQLNADYLSIDAWRMSHDQQRNGVILRGKKDQALGGMKRSKNARLMKWTEYSGNSEIYSSGALMTGEDDMVKMI